MMPTVFANLEIIFEFALKKMGLAAVAFDENVLGFHHALFGRDRFYALIFLVEPSHRNGGKRNTRSTKDVPRGTNCVSSSLTLVPFCDSKLDALLRADAGGERMLDFAH